MICRSLREAIDSLQEEVISLSEIRGELSDEDNIRIEKRLAELEAMLNTKIKH